MHELNRQTFADLPETRYFKTNEQAEKQVKKMRAFPGALGFDDETGGFIALHKLHSAAALPDEMPACLILKNLGFGLELLDETGGIFVPDLKIGNRYFELKRMSRAQNLLGAVHQHFQHAHRKADNLILHIDQPVDRFLLREAILEATKNYPAIRQVWVILQGNLWQLERKVILAGRFRF